MDTPTGLPAEVDTARARWTLGALADRLTTRFGWEGAEIDDRADAGDVDPLLTRPIAPTWQNERSVKAVVADTDRALLETLQIRLDLAGFHTLPPARARRRSTSSAGFSRLW